MKRFALLILIVAFMLSSCTMNYYLVVSDLETPMYSTVDGFDKQATIEAGKGFIYTGKFYRTSTRYGLFKGYSPTIATWKSLKKLSKKQLDDLVFTSDYGYTYSGISTSLYRYGRLTKANSPTYTPSSTSGTTSTKSNSSSGGTVHVKGYTRKDGTYVRPHTRSAPRRL